MSSSAQSNDPTGKVSFKVDYESETGRIKVKSFNHRETYDIERVREEVQKALSRVLEGGRMLDVTVCGVESALALLPVGSNDVKQLQDSSAVMIRSSEATSQCFLLPRKTYSVTLRHEGLSTATGDDLPEGVPIEHGLSVPTWGTIELELNSGMIWTAKPGFLMHFPEKDTPTPASFAMIDDIKRFGSRHLSGSTDKGHALHGMLERGDWQGAGTRLAERLMKHLDTQKFHNSGSWSGFARRSTSGHQAWEKVSSQLLKGDFPALWLAYSFARDGQVTETANFH